MANYAMELYHHGRLGQKWGKKNGPPYPLDYSKLSAEEIKQDKKRAIDEGDIVTANHNKNYFTYQEINDVINRFNLNQKLSELNKQQIQSGKDKAMKLADTLGTIATVANKVGDVANAVNKINNALNSGGSNKNKKNNDNSNNSNNNNSKKDKKDKKKDKKLFDYYDKKKSIEIEKAYKKGKLSNEDIVALNKSRNQRKMFEGYLEEDITAEKKRREDAKAERRAKARFTSMLG